MVSQKQQEMKQRWHVKFIRWLKGVNVDNSLVDPIMTHGQHWWQVTTSLPSNKQAVIWGLLAGLGFAPLPLWWISMIALGWLFAVVHYHPAANTKTLAYLGWSWGFGYHLASLYWICASLFVEPTKYLWLLPLAIIMVPAFLALFIGVAIVIYQRSCQALGKRWPDWRTTKQLLGVKGLWFSCCWLLGDLLRAGRWCFGGFPWNLTGYWWWISDTILQSCAVVGIYGLTLLTVWLATQLGNYIWIVRQKRSLLSGLILLAILCAYGQWRLHLPISTVETLGVRLVQNNVHQVAKMNPDNFAEIKEQLLQKLFNPYSELAVKPQLLVAGEVVLPTALNIHQSLLEELAMDLEAYQKVAEAPTKVILGSLHVDFATETLKQVHNSIYLLDGLGGYDTYHKNLLVPFGEYIPFARYLPFLRGLADTFGMSRGQLSNLLAYTPKIKLLPLVCYEAVFSGYPYRFLTFPHAADDRIIMVNLTNDDWFGRSSGPFQHLHIARVRAIETGLPMVRVSDTGISVVFDPYGRNIAKSHLDHEDILDVELPLENLNTIYKRIQLWLRGIH